MNGKNKKKSVKGKHNAKCVSVFVAGITIFALHRVDTFHSGRTESICALYCSYTCVCVCVPHAHEQKYLRAKITRGRRRKKKRTCKKVRLLRTRNNPYD